MWKKRYYSDVILRVGQPARDESRYSEICTVFITNGVAGFNLRGCPMWKKRCYSDVILRVGQPARDESRYSAMCTVSIGLG